uniref:Uncharacterized protein n=1 Tax=Hyaloperonospora arabidopsidis (strain Emoy2) TaxID=559515 RepID=M4C617_HYAAE
MDYTEATLESTGGEPQHARGLREKHRARTSAEVHLVCFAITRAMRALITSSSSRPVTLGFRRMPWSARSTGRSAFEEP